MRCICCNVALTDYESTRKSVTTNEFIDMCNKCFKTIQNDVAYKDRLDLLSVNDISDLDDIDIYLEDFDDF